MYSDKNIDIEGGHICSKDLQSAHLANLEKTKSESRQMIAYTKTETQSFINEKEAKIRELQQTITQLKRQPPKKQSPPHSSLSITVPNIVSEEELKSFMEANPET